MDNIQVKPVDVLGDTIIAARDDKGQVWAGVSYFCKALGMSNKQRDTQVEKVQTDRTLRRGTRKFPGGVFDQNNEVISIKIDFIPLWLAKIQITKKMEQDHPELADKLLEYQLKAKDILAAAFLPQQEVPPLTLQSQIRTIAQGTDELYQKVDEVNTKVDGIKQEFEAFKMDLPLLPDDADEISSIIKKRGVAILGGKESPAYGDRGLKQRVYSNIYSNLKYNFGKIRTYKAIKRNQKQQAIEIIEKYEPPLFLKDIIENANAQQSLDLQGGEANE